MLFTPTGFTKISIDAPVDSKELVNILAQGELRKKFSLNNIVVEARSPLFPTEETNGQPGEPLESWEKAYEINDISFPEQVVIMAKE